MKKARLYSCLALVAGALSLSSSFGAESPKAADAQKDAAAPVNAVPAPEEKSDEKQKTTDRKTAEATLTALITLLDQMGAALSGIKDKDSVKTGVAKLEIIKKVRDRLQQHSKDMPPPDTETSEYLMKVYGVKLEGNLNWINAEVKRIKKADYFESKELRTVMDQLLNASSAGGPIL